MEEPLEQRDQADSSADVQKTSTDVSVRVYPKRPGIVDQLLTLQEIKDAWGKSNWAIYKAANEGQIQVVERRGHQRYYVQSTVRALWGPPLLPGPGSIPEPPETTLK